MRRCRGRGGGWIARNPMTPPRRPRLHARPTKSRGSTCAPPPQHAIVAAKQTHCRPAATAIRSDQCVLLGSSAAPTSLEVRKHARYLHASMSRRFTDRRFDELDTSAILPEAPATCTDNTTAAAVDHVCRIWLRERERERSHTFTPASHWMVSLTASLLLLLLLLFVVSARRVRLAD